MVVTFDKKNEYIDPDYVLVWVPQRRHTDSVMTRPVIQKSRYRMYRQGHYARVKRPSGPELFEDASRILEELLQKQLNDELSAHGRRPRHRTAPLSTYRPVTSGEVLDERDEFGLDDGIERCKTMPSRMRGGSKDEPLPPKDVEGLRQKAGKRHKLPNDSPASSADTEGDSSSVSENRKKKSLLRKAKDRFLHAIHRQEREKENREKDRDSPNISPKKQPKKTPGKSNRNGLKESLTLDKKENGSGALDSKEGSQSSQVEVNGKRRNSAGKALIQTLRKSFRTKKDDRHSRVQDDGSSGRSKQSSSTQPTQPPYSSSSMSHTPSPDHALCSHGSSQRVPDDNTRPAVSSLVVPPGQRKDSSQSHHGKSPSPFPHSTSSDSHENGNRSGSLYSISSGKQVSQRRNVLDNPGEDIEFMDTEENDGRGDGSERRKADEKRGSHKHRSFKHQSSLCVDGDTDPDAQDGTAFNHEDLPLHERTAEEKEQMYGKIAQKLICIADTYAAESGMSDAETHGRTAGAQAAAEGDSLMELERQILECLRGAGDRNAQLMDGQAEEMIQATKAQTYERFKTTVQHSLGDNVSWNSLAFLFYTTKGVIAAVGKSNKLAGDAKEMTLRYFSDKFAKWIMDQGGFDSVLSESDSELD